MSSCVLPVALAAPGPALPLDGAADKDPYGTKIGGLPAWYDGVSPPAHSFLCKTCGGPLQFVVQMYAPDSGPRSLMLFCCPKPLCVASIGSWRCVRSQPPISTPAPATSSTSVVAPLSGGAAPAAGWDSGDFSSSDWGDGGGWGADAALPAPPSTPATAAPAKEPPSEIPVSDPTPAPAPAPTSLPPSLPAFSPVSLEWFDEPSSSAHDALSRQAQALLDRYVADEDEPSDGAGRAGALAGGGAGGVAAGGGPSESYERLSSADKHMLRFQEAIALAPSQCVRYCFGGQPLWPTPPPPPTAWKKAVPACPCGEARVFECQLLPTVINSLVARPPITSPATVDELDWDVVLVYACPSSCRLSFEEFMFVR